MELEIRTSVLRRPFTVKQKLKAIEIYNTTGSINRVIRYVNCSKATLYRWIKEYDGNEESIRNKSHKPKTNKNKLTEREISEILRMSQVYNTVGVIELYTIMRR